MTDEEINRRFTNVWKEGINPVKQRLWRLVTSIGGAVILAAFYGAWEVSALAGAVKDLEEDSERYEQARDAVIKVEGTVERVEGQLAELEGKLKVSPAEVQADVEKLAGEVKMYVDRVDEQIELVQREQREQRAILLRIDSAVNGPP